MIGRTNVGGGTGGVGGGATLVVSSPANVSVTVSKDNKAYTKNSGYLGSTTFKGLATGTWTITISENGQNATKKIEITADYAITIAFFSATINITYPANSDCVVTNSSGQTVASDTNATSSEKTFTATVNATGTYTVTATATDGSGNTKSESVEITSEGQSVSVALSCRLYLFREGIGQITPFTSKKETNSTISIDANGIVMNYSSESFGQVAVGTANVVDLRNYSKLIFDAICNRTTTNNTYTDGAAVISTNGIDYITQLSDFNAYNAMAPDGVRREYAIDISGFNGGYYIGAKGLIDGTIYNIWLE